MNLEKYNFNYFISLMKLIGQYITILYKKIKDKYLLFLRLVDDKYCACE